VGTRDSALDGIGVAGLRRAAADRDLAHVVPMDVVAGERNCDEKSLRDMLCMAGHGA
jgi:hypothetical protein